MYTQFKQKEGKQISRFCSPYEEPMAEKPISVRLSVELDQYVRSLPNRTEWLRQAIAAQVERDLQNKQSDPAPIS